MFENNDRTYINELYAKIYPCDGFNAIDPVHDADYIEYMDHPLTKLTSFLGLPNRPLSADKKQSAKNILKNLPTLLLPWNLLGLFPKIVVNILKLFTEFLPFLAAHKLHEIKCDDKRSIPVRVLAAWGSKFFNVLGLLGRCITSPVTSMRAALAYGQNEHPNDPVKAKIEGGLLAALSLAITITTYVILFPFVIYPLVAPLAAAATSFLPPVLINAFLVVKPYLEIIGLAFEAALGVSLVPAATGIAVIAGVLAAAVGPAFSRLMTKMTNWFYHGHDDIQAEAREKLRQDIFYEGDSGLKRPFLGDSIIENYVDGARPKSVPSSSYANLMAGKLSAESDSVESESTSDIDTASNESTGVESGYSTGDESSNEENAKYVSVESSAEEASLLTPRQ